MDLKSASIVQSKRVRHTVGRETGTTDKFGVVTTISKEANTPGQSKDFTMRASSEQEPGENRTRGLGNALNDPETNNEKTLRQRVKGQDLDKHEVTWDRQGYTTTSNATGG